MKYLFTAILLSVLSVSNSFAQSPQTGDFQGYTGSLYIGAETMRYTSQMTEQLLYSGSGLAISGAYSDVDYDADGSREVEGEYDTAYASIAYAHQFEHFSLGAAVTGVDADFESSGTTNPLVRHEMDADGFMGTVAALTEVSGFSVGLLATVGELSFDSSRRNGSVTGPKGGDFDVSTFQVELSASYEFVKEDAYSIRPYAKLGLVNLEADAFDETNAGTDDAEFDSFDDDYTYGEVGIRAGLLSMGDFVPYLKVSIWQDFGDDDIEVSGVDTVGNRFDGANALSDPDIAQTVARGELGFQWSVTDAVDLGASFAYEDGDAYNGYSAMLSFNWAL